MKRDNVKALAVLALARITFLGAQNTENQSSGVSARIIDAQGTTIEVDDLKLRYTIATLRDKEPS